MDLIIVVLLMLVAVVASSMIARALPLPVPVPFVQIASGVLIAARSDVDIALDPEVFLLLFAAPLLFLDGWRFPKEGLLRDRWTIVALAFGLVFFTVVCAGYFIHWLIPALPTAIAFALAAVLSPTDAVAVSAIAARTPLPRRLMEVLEGEALLNDASGLVCLRFAIAAALAGGFSIVEASLAFLWLALAGVAVGAGVAILINLAKDWVAGHYGEDTGSQILLSVLIPFGAYLAADGLGASGVLAAVSAGIVMHREERSGRALAITRLRRAAVWDAMRFAANGVIFVLLGQQLPAIVAGAGRAVGAAGHQNAFWLLVYVLAITAALAALRAVWAWGSLKAVLFAETRRGARVEKPGWPVVAATTLAGARGALTLAGVMTLPLTLAGGSAFPTRDLAILIAAGVIVASLLAASIGLPLVAPHVRLPAEPVDRHREGEARLAAAEAAIRMVESAAATAPPGPEDAALYARVARRVVDRYRQQIALRLPPEGEADAGWKADAIETALLRLAHNAERHELHERARTGRLSDEELAALVRDVDLRDSQLADH